MHLTPQELELISIATEFTQEDRLRNLARRHLEKFPPKLKDAKDYFVIYEGIKDIYAKYRKLSAKEGAQQEEILKNKLTTMEKQINLIIKRAESPLKEYLNLHLLVYGQFSADGKLTLKERRKESLRKKGRTLYNKLKLSEFPLANRLFDVGAGGGIEIAEKPEWQEVLNNLIEGKNRGDIVAAIKLANEYFAAFSAAHKPRLDFLKNELGANDSIKILNQGIQKNIPTAISSASNIISTFLTASNFLYKTEETEDNKERIKEMGKIATELCKSLKLKDIQDKIQQIMDLPSRTPEDNVASRKVAKEMAKSAEKNLILALNNHYHQLEKLPVSKMDPYKESMMNIIENLDNYITQAKGRQEKAITPFFKKGREKNMQFAKELRDKLIVIVKENDPTLLSVEINKLKNTFQTSTTSDALNQVLEQGIDQLYAKIPKPKP